MSRTLPFGASSQHPVRYSPQPIRIVHARCSCGDLVRVDVDARKPPQPAVCARCLPTLLTTQESALYPLELNQDGATAHSHLCTGAFGRYDLHCRRCLQLRDGAERRTRAQRKQPLGQRLLPL